MSIDKIKDILSNGERDVAFDFETTSLFPRRGEIVGVSIAIGNKAWWFPDDEGKDVLQLIAGMEDVNLIAHNMAFDYKWLRYKWGIDPECSLRCTILMAWLLDENYNPRGLKHLVLRFFDYQMTTYEEAFSEETLFDDNRDEQIAEYAKDDSLYCLKLYNALLPEIKDQNLYEEFTQLEMPVCRITAEMEYNGIRVDEKGLHNFSVNVRKEIDDVSEEIYDIVGKRFLISSPEQVSRVLFSKERMGFPTDVSEKGKNGSYSTAKAVLKKLDNDKRVKSKLPGLLLRFRELSKFIDSFTGPFSHYLRESADNRIHPSFNQAGTVTGRYSSKEPNLQNVPTGMGFRDIFIPKEGRIFCGLDYSQVELRVLAHFSKEPRMIDAFRNDEDIHERTRKLLGLKKNERRKAKTTNFGIVYNIQKYSLAEQLGVSPRYAGKLIDRFFEKYKYIGYFQKEIRNKLSSQEPVIMLSGRKRRVFAQKGINEYKFEAKFRQLFNSIIQGSAADIIKIAMRNIRRWADEEGIDLKILLQVHDELLLSFNQNETVYEYYKKIVEIMESVVELRVPIKVDGYIGKHWVKEMKCPKCGEEIDLLKDIVIKNGKVYSDCCIAYICKA